MLLCRHCGTPSLPGSCAHCGRSVTHSTLSAGVVLLGVGLAVGGSACISEAEYGVPASAYLDEDGDGYLSDVDCDDLDADRHPNAEELPGDGIDSNCDGEDDT